ncbi:hypothetical protein KIN34_15850 [Cellulomonas sp. DKR-3]|uniref:SCP domain-containing protein n=1 Tax=Cellulomonas fulva TaxID=2835530 RepID=A0ABS5U2Y5_9CELL|nr:CAP domain-containing protein [Cellulomonas fulva]MBT0995753.1 hypothetical protein [Cellulomonas fulva]
MLVRPAPSLRRPVRSLVVASLAVATVVALAQAPAQAEDAGAPGTQVGAAPTAPTASAAPGTATSSGTAAGGDLVTAGTADRVPSKAWVSSLWRKTLEPSLAVPVGWTGSEQACSAGQESSASRAATLRTINAMRKLVQLDPVRFDADANVRARKAALIMSANDTLTHSPSSSMSCWSSDGQKAAGQSNLALGIGGARSIALYMADPGQYNTAAGHRRWILNPTTTVMATGSTQDANALTVFGLGTSDAQARPQFLEWPARGWFPAELEPDGRWSLSASNRYVSFARASVSVRLVDGKGRLVRQLPVTVVSRDDRGYGPNTVVFQVGRVAIPKASAVKAYRVSVRGISGGAASSYSYTVRLFHP